MTGLIATASAGFHEKPVILTIFAGTYLGIAAGRVPFLKLNRVGIALLGAIAMMIVGNVTTAAVVSFVNWPTIFLLFGFFVISAQLRLSGFYDKVAGGISARLGTSRAVSARPDAGDRRAFRVPQSRHRLLRFHADCRGRAPAQTDQSGSIFDRAGDFEQHRRGRHAHRQSAGHDDRPGRAPEFWPLHSLEQSFRSFLRWPPPTESSGCCRANNSSPRCPFPRN